MQTLRKPEKKKKIEYICYNPECFKNGILTRYNTITDRPIIFLASNCWNCKTRKFLRVKNGS